MAITVNRFLHTNLVQALPTVLSASSEQTSHPRSWLKDQLRSKTWRSKLGWTIVAGVNDKLDFNRGGVKVATLTAGTYAAGADMCVAIVAALETADATPVWACTYSGATFKYTISSDLASVLLFGTGANLATSIASDLGFTTTDTPNVTSHAGDNAVYQSRHWIKVDLVTAQAVTAAVIINMNGAQITLQGNATDVWTAPTVNQAITGDSAIRIAYIGSQTLRYWRLLITDQADPVGYTEIGIWYLGTYVQTSVTYTIGWQKRWEELSEVLRATNGAPWQLARPRLREYTLSWSEIPDADRVKIEAAAAACPLGKAMFLALDAGVVDTDTVYGYIAQGIVIEGATTVYFNTGLVFSEALG